MSNAKSFAQLLPFLIGDITAPPDSPLFHQTSSHAPFQNLAPYPLLHTFSGGKHNWLPSGFPNIASEISTNQLLNLMLAIYHVYILVDEIILSLSFI
jgi:hypothetical protein